MSLRVVIFCLTLTLLFTLSTICCSRDEDGLPMIYPAGNAAWGPDDWIVFVYSPWYVSEGETLYVPDSDVLWLIRPDGKGLHSIAERETPDGAVMGLEPNWSPDGDWIVANDILGRIWLISADGDSLVQITSEGKNFFPTFSPDGKKIAFSTPDSDVVGQRGIRILDIETKEEKFVYPYGIDPSWSPDGDSLVFYGWISTNEGLIVCDTSGNNAHIVHPDKTEDGIESPSFSPDGTKIVFSKPRGWRGGVSQIWVINSDGSNPKKLTKRGGRWPSWSPDGLMVVYTRYSFEDPDQEGSGELYIMDSYGLWRKRLTYLNY